MLGSLRIQLIVVGALLLRDLKTRFGGREIFYIFALAMPIGHVVVMAAIWMILKRPVPIGTDPWIFSATSILPFVIFTYPQRQIAVSIMMNKPLMYFPRVKITDIIIARSILESLTAFVAAASVLFILTLIGSTISPKDPFLFTWSLISALYFGVAVGMLNGIIVACWSGWLFPSMVISPVLWASCGAMFMIDTIPSPYRELLALNPLLHCVELARYSYYWDYRTSVLDASYPLMVSTTLIALVLGVERLIRGKIAQG